MQKDNSPELPSLTCPYIDFIQHILEEIKDSPKSIYTDVKIEIANSVLEYVRESNDQLRKNSEYWMNKKKSK